MKFNNIKITAEDVEVNRECSEKINQIAAVANKISKSPNVNIRLVRNGVIVEGLLWGTLDKKPIGAFSRGISASMVLDGLSKRVKKECLRMLQSKVRHQDVEPWDQESARLANVG